MLATVGQSFTTTDTLTVLQCGKCGIVFAVPESFDRKNQETGGSWHCPNGHLRIYRESEADKLRRQLEREKQFSSNLSEQKRRAIEQRDAAKRCAAAQKGQKTRIKNRIARGVCPCCNRTFANIGAHMQQEHPHFIEQD